MAHCPASAGRPPLEMADIVRAHRAEFERHHHLTQAQRRVLSAIELCRTAALGGHLEVCRHCGFQRPVYNSCRNRHCPKCQALAQEKWIAARSARMLPVGHFHVVFTLPSELRPLVQRFSKLSLDALFRAASETLLDLGGTRLRGLLGATMVLHTWTRDLRFHPHVHAIVTAGALDDVGTWQPTSIKYLFPVAVLAQVFRGKMLGFLRRMHTRGQLQQYDDFRDPQAFARLTARLAHKSWCVYAKRPFRRTDHLLGYLGRYTHRVAIANSRLVDVRDDAVTFRTKNGKTQTLHPVRFLLRFVQHVLPAGFKKIRHFGVYASTHRDQLELARRQILATVAAASAAPASATERLPFLTARDLTSCPQCGAQLEQIPLVVAVARAPPQVAA